MSNPEFPNSQRLTKTSLSDQAAEALRHLVLRNELPCGSVVTEREISEHLGISRTPVREAMRTLISEGLFVISEKGRIAVANPDLETIINLVQILGALEGLASEIAAEHATDQELAVVGEHCAKMETLQEPRDEFEYFDANIAFHRAIVAASHNPQLAQMHKVVDDQLYQARYRSSREQWRREIAITEHTKIVEALMARNGPEARRAMTAHLQTTIRNLREVDKKGRSVDSL